jgi:hypothetical protein
MVLAAVFLNRFVAVALGLSFCPIASFAQASSQNPQPAASSHVQVPVQSRLYYVTTPRSTLEIEAHSVPADDEGRFAHLKAEFAKAGCGDDMMRVQPVVEKPGAAANLICTWPGNSAFSIVVVAHYRHEGKGEGAIENWSGAILLPYLYLAVQAQPRENTFVFLESYGEAGTADYMKSLTREQKRQIRAVVSVEALGVSPVTRYYTPYPDTRWMPASSVHLKIALLLATLADNRVARPDAVTPHWLSIDDSQPFRYSDVPCILLHSIPYQSAALPGSRNDTAAAVDGNAYYQNYRAIAVYLVDLDRLAEKLKSDDPVWHGVGGQFHLDLNDLPLLR